jgi:hypothetical protein
MDVGSPTASPTGLSAQRSTSEQRQQMLSVQQTVRQLAARDMEVRAHEQAHAAVGGPHAGAPNYQFTEGPNGVRYAESGHVNIDVSAVPGDPNATLKKMQTVARAALAPAQPSSADRAVAAKANAQAAQARVELAQQNQSRLDTVTQIAESDSTYNRRGIGISNEVTGAIAAGRIIDLIA